MTWFIVAAVCLIGFYAKISAGLSLQEKQFANGTPGASSIYSTSNPASYAFERSTRYWHSGRDSQGQGGQISFPHLIWYDFTNPFVPGRISFRPRLADGCPNGSWCGATKWQFIGTNDKTCDQYAKWTIICEDLSGKPFERQSQSKYCTVADDMRKAFRCLGISVLDSSWMTNSEVSMGGIRMWEKILTE